VRALAWIVLALLGGLGCCFPLGTPQYLSVDERQLSGDLTHLTLPFRVENDDQHTYALPGHARIEIRDMPYDSSGLEGTLGTLVCAFERDVTESDFGSYPYGATLDAAFSPPCPPPPSAPGIVREGLFTFTTTGYTFPAFPIHELPPALSGGRDRDTVRDELASPTSAH
jgi:hypothetical protein